MTHRANARTVRRLTVALVILAAIGAGGWWIALQIKAALGHIELAESRLAATRQSLSLTLDYVEQKHDWPRSWEDLFSLTHWRFGRNPQDTTAFLREHAEIDFGAPLEEVRAESPSMFHEIRPRGGAAAIPLEPDYANFLNWLRQITPPSQ